MEIKRAIRLGAVTCLVSLAAVWSPGSQAKDVVMYTADGLESFYQQIMPAFERETGMRVVRVTGGSGAVVNRLEIQRDQPKADVLVTLPPFMQQAVAKGLLVNYVSSQDSAIPMSNKGKDGAYYSFMNNYFSFIHNPKIVKNPPKYFSELLKPEYKDKIAYSNPLTAGDGMSVINLLVNLKGEQKAFEYLAKLEPNVKFHTKGTGALDVMVSRGEIEIANGDLQMDLADENQGGLSIKPFFLTVEGEKPSTFKLPYFVALVKDGPNAEGGKKLIDYLLSKTVQQQDLGFFGEPARSDVTLTGKNGEQLKALLGKANIIEIDWDAVLKQQAGWEKKWRNSVVNASITEGQ